MHSYSKTSVLYLLRGYLPIVTTLYLKHTMPIITFYLYWRHEKARANNVTHATQFKCCVMQQYPLAIIYIDQN